MFAELAEGQLSLSPGANALSSITSPPLGLSQWNQV